MKKTRYIHKKDIINAINNIEHINKELIINEKNLIKNTNNMLKRGVNNE